MRQAKMIWVVVLAAALVALPACGGSGQGFRASATDPLVIMTTSIPAGFFSGQEIDIVIELEGGCSGPYVVKVVSGNLPEGVGTDDTADTSGAGAHRHHLTGILLEAGTFSFRLQITDTNCTPNFFAEQDYVWNVDVGPVAIVAANPPIIPVAEYDDPQKYTDIDALEPIVFNQFVSYNLIVAGGSGDYTCDIIDDPLDPFDGLLPLAMQLPPGSCDIVGRPGSVGPGGKPFRLTIQATDSNGQSTTRKFQLKVDTPPLVQATPDLPNGKAGTQYGEPIQVADGVPPFKFEFVDNAPAPDPTDTLDGLEDGVKYASPAVPTIANTKRPGSIVFNLDGTTQTNRLSTPTTGGTHTYPPEGVDGSPYDIMPPEGMYMVTAAIGGGTVAGTPRRVGNFTVCVHVYSSLVPNEKGQHLFVEYEFDIADSEPPVGVNPAFSVDATFTDQGAPAATTAPYNTIPEFEVGQPYDPDGGPAGLQFLGQGGVPFDGLLDEPHDANTLPNPEETRGPYPWEVDYDPLALGTAKPPGIDLLDAPAGALFSDGLFGLEPGGLGLMTRQPKETYKFILRDSQLPIDPLRKKEVLIDVGVGPDLVIIADSLGTTVTATTTTSNGQYDYHDASMRIRTMQVVGGSGTLGVLSSTNLTNTQVLPADAVGGNVSSNTDLGGLIGGTVGGGTDTVDLMETSINPTGWWNDNHNMNVNGPRSMQHADQQRSWSGWNANYRSGGGSWQPNTSAVNLPDASGVPGVAAGTANRITGVFADGGRMYAFETEDSPGNPSTGHSGFFIIRSDSSIYVPFAFSKAGSYKALADGVSQVHGANTHNRLRTPQITVSPDGRWAACKVTMSTFYSGSSSSVLSTRSALANSRIVLFSLCGERPAAWGGANYKVIDPEDIDGITGANYCYASSMALTNEYLYFINGQNNGYQAGIEGHWVMRYEVLGGAANAEVLPGAGNWTQTDGGSAVPMDVPFHKWDNTMSRSSSFSSSGTTFYNTTNDEMYLYDGANFTPSSLAPMPFRVNAEGNTCAILAGPNESTSGNTTTMSHYVWVDYDGNGPFQASTARRHSPQGGGRGSSLTRGPSQWWHWGRYTGPTTGFEISDDGHRVAVCYNNHGAVNWTSSTSEWNNNRQDIVACSTSNSWVSSSEDFVTRDFFGGSVIWRFGSLIFTKDNDGLIFWGGGSSNNLNSTSASTSGLSPQSSYHYVGTYYAFDFLSPTSVRGIMPTSAGGVGSFPQYTTSSKFSPTPTSTYVQSAGNLRPYGGFMSKNRCFYYVTNGQPMSSSDQTQLQLVGINVSTLSAGVINGNTNGRGFKVANQDARFGFLPNYYYQPHYVLDFAYYMAAHSQGMGIQTMAKDTGWVFWGSHYQASGPSNRTGTSSFSVFSGPAIAMYWGDYGYRGGRIYGMNAEVGGPAARLDHGLGSNTASRAITLVDVADDGTRLGYIYNTGGTTMNHTREIVGYIKNIKFDANSGAIDASFSPGSSDTDGDSRRIETSTGRAGESIAHDSGGKKMYYAFQSTSSGNMGQLELKEMRIDSAGAHQTLDAASNRWFRPLHSGR